MRDFTVYDILRRNALVCGDETAVAQGDIRCSHGELLTRVDALADDLSRRGVGRGDRVAVLAYNHRHFFPLFGACAKLGAILVSINWRLAADEIGYIVNDASPKLLFTDGEFGETLSEISAPSGMATLDFSEIPESAISDLKDAEHIPGDAPLCLIYTAAVAGRPRGATLSHANLVSANLQTIATMGITAADAYLNMLPLFHITGLNLALAALHVGGKNVVMAKFNEDEAVRLTSEEKITLWGSFPPMLGRLTEAVARSNKWVPSLRHVMGLDGPDTIRAFEEKTGATFWMLYGQTETSGLVSFSPAREKPGSAGKIGMLTQVRLEDEAGKALPGGEIGEIAVRGPLVFKGFWNLDDDNRHVFRGGWHHTGDLGQLDADGYLWFKGRKPEKELIKPGGENVYPAEVEAVILEHPDVAEVSVIGVPDPKFGEGIKAVCVLKPGVSLTGEALAEFVASKIARYKKPRYLEFVDKLPKTADGKVDRQAVKAAHGGQ